MNIRRTTLLACVLLSLGAAACADVDGETEGVSQETETADEQAIYNGTEITGAGENQQWEGIVQIRMPRPKANPADDTKYGSCTAWFITDRHLVTSAHCFDNWNQVTVQYRAPTLNQGKWVKPTTVLVTKNEQYYPDADQRSADIAVIELPAPEAWANEDRRFRLFEGSTSLTQLHIYGYGKTNNDGGSGKLRSPTGRTQIRLVRHEDGYFVANAHTARICPGDSGGPAIKEGALAVVWGVNTSSRADEGDCPSSGDEMMFTKINYNIAFIERALGFQCDPFYDDGQYFKQCW